MLVKARFLLLNKHYISIPAFWHTTYFGHLIWYEVASKNPHLFQSLYFAPHFDLVNEQNKNEMCFMLQVLT